MHTTTILVHSVPFEHEIPSSFGRSVGEQVSRDPSRCDEDRAVTITDGRRIRRALNRDRVMEGFIGCARRLGVAPDTVQLADASRVSVRSIYRYFATHQQLLASVAVRLAEHAADHFAPDDTINGNPNSRISSLVDDSLLFCDLYGPAIELVSTSHRCDPAIDASLRRIHESQCCQIDALLDPELAHDEHRVDTTAIIGVLLAVGSLTLLRDTFADDTIRIRPLLHRQIVTQLGLPDAAMNDGQARPFDLDTTVRDSMCVG